MQQLRNELIHNISTHPKTPSYDLGLKNTAAMKSSICFIDGKEGILWYRGIPIEALVEHSTFLEVLYLLVYGNLPNSDEMQLLANDFGTYQFLPTWMEQIIQRAPVEDPSANLAALINFLKYNDDKQSRADMGIHSILPKIPTIIAYLLRAYQHLPFIQPDPKLSYISNVLHMFGVTPNPEFNRALDQILIVQAEHQLSLATFTARNIATGGNELTAALSAAVNALAGTKHGGANALAYQLFDMIDKGDMTIDDVIQKSKEKTHFTQFRIPGIGHRIYKTHDPRAQIIRAIVRRLYDQDLLPKKGLFDLAEQLADTIENDSHFTARGLYTNVDFFSGFIYAAMGIPVDFYPVMFALSATSGYTAHWLEEKSDPQSVITRPSQLYCGPTEPRAYIQILNR